MGEQLGAPQLGTQTQNVPISTHSSAVLPGVSRGRKSSSHAGNIVNKQELLNSSAQPEGGCVEPTITVSQCVGRKKGGLSIPGGWLSFTQRTPSTTTMFVPPSPGLGLHGVVHQFPSSRQDSKTLSHSSEKHYFILICCSLCPPGEQGG